MDALSRQLVHADASEAGVSWCVQNPRGQHTGQGVHGEISLGPYAVCANFVRFRGSVPLLPHLCPLSVPEVGYKFTPRAVASPDAPQKRLVRKRARSGGAQWLRVNRHEPGSQAKKPRTAKSQQPAYTHKEHDILSTVEATALAAQFLDQKVYPTKASQQEFLATCIKVDVEKNVLCVGISGKHSALIQHITRCGAVCGQGQSCCGLYVPL